jgi:LuxR family transcriptional regulator, maltose regulon positive regulatory protein
MPNESAKHVAIEAKHLRPRFDHVSLRPDSLAAFATAFAHRLTVVCAPAGYGKTSMTAAALDSCGMTAAWYKLDILDHDPITFLASMIRALQRTLPEFGASLLRELEASPVVDVPVEVLAARFCSECDEWLAADLHLVLDDYHEAMDSAAMNDVLGYLLENCPGTLHFVVLTRYEPTFRLEKLHLAGEVARLQRDLLVFDAGQVAEVLARRSGRSYDPGHVQRVLELTEGWPASVVLAGMALTWLDVGSLQDALSDPRLRGDVFSYLAEQVFQRQTKEVQLFLLGTCCLEHVTVELAELLTNSGRASRHLNFLAKNHIFTFDTERRGAFRYHNLLRDFLVQRFVQDEGETAFRALQRRTAVALEDCGDRPAAIELLLSANELDLALGVVSRGGEMELERCPSERLRLWAECLSPSVRARQPWALILQAVLATRDGHFSAALEYLELASTAFESDGDNRSLYQALSVREWAEFWSGDCAASMATCYRALDLATTDAEQIHSLLSLLSAAVDLKRWDVVAEASNRAGMYQDRTGPEEAARAQGLKAHAAYFQGDMFAAHQLITASHDHGRRLAQRAAALNIRGMIETALSDYALAETHLQEAAAIAKDFGDASTFFIVEDSRAYLASAIGDTEQAVTILKELSSDASPTQEPSLQAYAHCHLGTALRRSGYLAESIGPTRRATELIALDRDPYLTLNVAANLRLTQGLQGVDAAAALLSLSEQAATLGLRFVELKALLFLAVLLDLQEDHTQAVETLELCVPRQLQLGHLNLLAQELGSRPDLTSRVLRRHRRNGFGPELVSAVARYPRFSEVRATLIDQGSSQARTWINRISQEEVRFRPHSTQEFPIPMETPSRRTGAFQDLTKREAQVLTLMAADRSNDEIASALFISVPTVKTHVTHILRKLGQKTRIGAILEYQRLGRQLGSSTQTSSRKLHPPR